MPVETTHVLLCSKISSSWLVVKMGSKHKDKQEKPKEKVRKKAFTVIGLCSNLFAVLSVWFPQ